MERRVELQAALDVLLGDYDAILTPATTGEAPLGLEATGSPIFCTLWTLCGAPAITLPLGVPLVGAKGDDARLLRTAQWLVAQRTAPAANLPVD